jgi:hypothetical protein
LDSEDSGGEVTFVTRSPPSKSDLEQKPQFFSRRYKNLLAHLGSRTRKDQSLDEVAAGSPFQRNGKLELVMVNASQFNAVQEFINGDGDKGDRVGLLIQNVAAVVASFLTNSAKFHFLAEVVEIRVSLDIWSLAQSRLTRTFSVVLQIAPNTSNFSLNTFHCSLQRPIPRPICCECLGTESSNHHGDREALIR